MDLATIFAQLNLTDTHLQISHAPAALPAEWQEALKATTTGLDSKDWSLVKSMLIKTKPNNPIFIIALDTTEAPANALAKALGCKEGRLAADDFLASTLKVANKNEGKYMRDLK
jgi:hypothetical protein